MRWMVAIALVCAGCDVEAEPQEHAPVSTSFMGAEPPCPEGAVARGDAPPMGLELWCEKPSGTRHGYHVKWNLDGLVTRREAYADGLRHGLTQLWDDRGRMTHETPYERGREHGEVLRWVFNEDDPVRHSSTAYKHGLMHGWSRSWFGDILINEGERRDGSACGTHKSWHDDGTPKSTKVFPPCEPL